MKLRTQIFVFIAITLALSWAYQAFLITHNGIQSFGISGLVILMAIPGAVSVVLRAVARLGFRDIGWRLGPSRYYVMAFVIPLVLATLVNLFGVLLDMKGFAPIPFARLVERGGVVVVLLLMGTLGAFGEELGWRGFLLPKMVEDRWSRPLLWSGVVWGLWHLPIVMWGGYYTLDNPPLIGLVYFLSIVSIGTVSGWLRMRSGSIWVATVFHALHNYFFQLVIPFLVFSGTGSNTKWWDVVGSDCGILVAALYLATFWGLQRKWGRA